MVVCKLFSSFIHFELLVFLNLVVLHLPPNLKFSSYSVILVQKIYMFKAQNFLPNILSNLFTFSILKLKVFFS